jgi:alkylation response protein AidB-like acyl-CoA dehydrogenase
MIGRIASPDDPPRAALNDIVAQLMPRFAQRAAQADADDAFVAANYADLKSSDLIAAAVPAELGGLGAGHADLCEMLRRIASACGSTALAFSMHTHQVATAAWRWKHQQAPVDGLLRRVADERIVLLSSGGSDWLPGSGSAQRTDDGYRVTAKKLFTSAAPAGDLLLTCAIAEDEPGRREVLHFAVPMNTPGVRVASNWKTLGMRGTGSHDVALENVFVADAAISLRRAPDVWHPMFQIVTMFAVPFIYSVYLGIAQAARDRVLALARRRRQTARVLDLAGAVHNEVRAAELAQADMLAAAATNEPGFVTTNRIFTARALLASAALRSADLGFDLAGGAGFFRDAGFERLFRDLQGARFHLLQDGDQRRLAAAMALGLDPDALPPA